MIQYESNPHLVVSAFAYFMSCQWSRETANDIFGMVMGDHFYHEWCNLNDLYKSANAASMGLYFNMDSNYRKKLVEWAMKFYNEREWLNYQ